MNIMILLIKILNLIYVIGDFGKRIITKLNKLDIISPLILL